jgi:hydrogenase maturation protease
MQPWHMVVLVDTYARHSVPGHLEVLEIRPEDVPDEPAVIDGHSLHPLAVLAAVKQQKGILPRVLLVGCEPETFGPEEGIMELTPDVKAAVEPAMAVIAKLIGQEKARGPEELSL